VRIVLLATEWAAIGAGECRPLPVFIEYPWATRSCSQTAPLYGLPWGDESGVCIPHTSVREREREKERERVRTMVDHVENWRCGC
jgi:hypothetical protein